MNRSAFGAWAFAYLLLLAFLVPPFLRTPLECDPQVFDLYVRDAERGALLYRDMLENNTPIMIGIQYVVRSTLGWSSEALRVVDLLVVGSGILGLVMWFPRDRSTLRWLLLFALTACYLTLSEWCHAQRDVWLLAPVMAALHLRRINPNGTINSRLLEGLLWGAAVVLKPHVVIVGFAVWLTSNWRSRSFGASVGNIISDTVGVVLGATAVVILTVISMAMLDLLQPYILHLKGWGGDYARANFYGPHGATVFRIQFAIRLMPWTLIYAVAFLYAAFSLIRMLGGQRQSDDCLLWAALIGWAIQAFAFQHVFDYPHIAPILISIAILYRWLESRNWLVPGTLALLAAMLFVKGPFLVERAKLWKGCFQPQLTPAFRDRLNQIDFISWDEIAHVAEYAKLHGYTDGDVNVISDSALPFWQLSGLRPPTRYYLFSNNFMAFPSKRQEILKAVGTLPHLKVIVCDLTRLRWQATATTSPHDLPDDWYGSARWADRVVFRSGRYAIVAMDASEIQSWLTDVSDWEI